MAERPLEVSEHPLDLPRRLTDAQLVAAPRRLPPPLPVEVEDAPPPGWHRLLLTGFLVVELAWLALLGLLVAWLLL
jgi:hypothetical protein